MSNCLLYSTRVALRYNYTVFLVPLVSLDAAIHSTGKTDSGLSAAMPGRLCVVCEKHVMQSHQSVAVARSGSHMHISGHVRTLHCQYTGA